MVGSLDQIQADQGGPRSRKTCRVTHLQLQEPKTIVPSASKSMESHRVKLGGKQLLTIGGSWRRSLAYKRSHRIGRCSLKGTCPVEGCDRRHHAQLYATIETPKLNPSSETFHPSQADVEGTPTTGTPTTYATCGVIDECASVRRPGRVALQMLPLILQGKNGIRIKANAFLDGGSGSSYLKEEIADVLGLEAESRPLRVSVFGAKSIVTDSKTVTVQLESMDGGAKREILLWTTPNICEMKEVDWFHTARSLIPRSRQQNMFN